MFVLVENGLFDGENGAGDISVGHFAMDEKIREQKSALERSP
jgi:hypothetical protein